MAKRFTDTDKWKKQFIRSLKAPYKLLWFYILDDCDHAGIWDVDMDIASLKIGVNVTIDGAVAAFGEHIVIIDSEKWFIPDFTEFQYGKLNHENRVHKSVIERLKKFNLSTSPLLAPYKPLISPMEGCKDTYTDKDKDKDKGLLRDDFPKKVSDVWEEASKIGYAMTKDEAEKFLAHYQSIGWEVNGQKIKDWKARLVTWKASRYEFNRKAKNNGSNKHIANTPADYNPKDDGRNF